MTVSVIIPACDVEAVLPRALASLTAQTHGDWTAIIVSDDGRDYAAFLDGRGLGDPRFTFASTGGIRTGCHNARNVGFSRANGDFVTQLDADDAFRPERLATLLPWAERHGAAADNLLMIDDDTEEDIGTVMDMQAETTLLDLAAFMRLNAPLVPLIRRDHVVPRVPGVEFAEDVVANIQLIDRIGTLPVTAASSYLYRIRSTSMANEGGAAERFERGYTDYIDRLEAGDGFGLQPGNRRVAADGLIAKRALNRAFMDAQKIEPGLSFADFAKRGSG
jgi:glycosyltransferase involved in cell wall biosynthesis